MSVARNTIGEWTLKSVDGIVRFWRPFPTIEIASADPVEKVAAQLRASVPVEAWETKKGKAEDWVITGRDRSREFAKIFVEYGIRDLSKLILIQCTFTREHGEIWMGGNPETGSPDYKVKDARTETQTGFSLSNDGASPVGFMYAGGKRETRMRESPVLHVMRSVAGDGGVRLVMRASDDGFYFVPNWYSTSDAGKIREIIKGVAGAALFVVAPLAGINVAASIGGTIMGPLASTYPALTSAIGRVAISTALSGGDLKNALKITALSMVGSQIGTALGNVVSNSTKLDLLGKVTEAATRTALAGGNVKQAVGMALLNNGIASMGQLLGEGDDVIPSWEAPSASNDLPAIQYQMPPVPDIPIPDVAVAASPGIDWAGLQKIVTNVTNTALTVAKGVQAVKSLTSTPKIITTAQTTSGAARTTAFDSGYVQQTQANGQIVRQAPPVGVIQGTVSGNLLVNNGDGTYTLIAPDGTQKRLSYSTGVANVQGNIPLPQSLSSVLATTISTPIGNIPVLPIVGIGLALFLMGAMGNRR